MSNGNLWVDEISDQTAPPPPDIEPPPFKFRPDLEPESILGWCTSVFFSLPGSHPRACPWGLTLHSPAPNTLFGLCIPCWATASGNGGPERPGRRHPAADGRTGQRPVPVRRAAGGGGHVLHAGPAAAGHQGAVGGGGTAGFGGDLGIP